MISMTIEAVTRRAQAWVQQLERQGVVAHVVPGESTIGGGSLPGEVLPTSLVALEQRQCVCSLDELAQRLRQYDTPVVARITHDKLLLDPRTVLEEQDEEVLRALVAVCRA
jgi:L-seryl-tRNA(Ser) seleniumtransferase